MDVTIAPHSAMLAMTTATILFFKFFNLFNLFTLAFKAPSPERCCFILLLFILSFYFTVSLIRVFYSNLATEMPVFFILFFSHVRIQLFLSIKGGFWGLEYTYDQIAAKRKLRKSMAVIHRPERYSQP